MATEIYSCKDGQTPEQGRMDLVHDVTTRDEAQSDAERRCKRDPSLKKVIYYGVAPSGDFKLLFSYNNPDWKATAKAPAAKPKRAIKKPPAKLTLLGRIKKAIGW